MNLTLTSLLLAALTTIIVSAYPVADPEAKWDSKDGAPPYFEDINSDTKTNNRISPRNDLIIDGLLPLGSVGSNLVTKNEHGVGPIVELPPSSLPQKLRRRICPENWFVQFDFDNDVCW